MSPARVAAIGECMVELRHLDASTLALSFGGDTLNTAVYLRRCGSAAGISVDYVTALGDDPYSDTMLAAWQAEGLGTGLVTRLADRQPGLYLIRIDAAGERSFTYYRSQSAARELFRAQPAARLDDHLVDFDWLYTTGITLSIFDPESLRRLWQVLDRARARGGRVAFDSNHRPAGWPDGEAARAAVTQTLARVDLALPALDDHRRLFGDADAATCARRLHDLGVPEVVVKLGPNGCLLSNLDGQRRIPAAVVRRVVDTTAAGDAFNGAYLAARLAGAAPPDAARAGSGLAAAVIAHPGALIPADAMPWRAG